MTSNRVEVVAAVHAVSKFGAAAVLLSPAWKVVEVSTRCCVESPPSA
jgi:acyl-coenzyme A synthetase/AMP-(fatty) acid ligase